MAKLPQSHKNHVMQIVMKNLPLPDNMTPWEQIVDYKNDPQSQKNLLALKMWIKKISSDKQTAQEIQEEIEWLMNEFEKNMQLHKMKSNVETVETIVKIPLDLLENVVKLKFSKLLEPIFSIKKRQISLLEAEMNAPGREIAYVLKARDVFPDQ